MASSSALIDRGVSACPSFSGIQKMNLDAFSLPYLSLPCLDHGQLCPAQQKRLSFGSISNISLYLASMISDAKHTTCQILGAADHLIRIELPNSYKSVPASSISLSTVSHFRSFLFILLPCVLRSGVEQYKYSALSILFSLGLSLPNTSPGNLHLPSLLPPL